MNVDILLMTIIAESVALAMAVTAVIGSALYFRAHVARTSNALAKARPILFRLLEESVYSEPDIHYLKSLPLRLQRVLVTELAPKLEGQHRQSLRNVANELGLIARCHTLCRSRWRWKRLHGARLLTILWAGESIMPSLLHDASPYVRSQACLWAADHPSEEVIVELLGLLEDSTLMCRFAAKDALHRIGTAVIEPVVSFLENAPIEKILLVVEATIGTVDPRLLKYGLSLSEDRSAQARELSARVLGAFGGEDAVAAISLLLDDAEAEVRAAGAIALGQLAHWPAAPQLVNLLDDPSWQVRKEAGMGLLAMGAPGRLFMRRRVSTGEGPGADMASQVLSLPETTARSMAG